MTAITLWLLVSLQSCRYTSCAVPATTVARFADAQECERVRLLMKDKGGNGDLLCIQAKAIP